MLHKEYITIRPDICVHPGGFPPTVPSLTPWPAGHHHMENQKVDWPDGELYDLDLRHQAKLPKLLKTPRRNTFALTESIQKVIFSGLLQLKSQISREVFGFFFEVMHFCFTFLKVTWFFKSRSTRGRFACF